MGCRWHRWQWWWWELQRTEEDHLHLLPAPSESNEGSGGEIEGKSSISSTVFLSCCLFFFLSSFIAFLLWSFNKINQSSFISLCLRNETISNKSLYLSFLFIWHGHKHTDLFSVERSANSNFSTTRVNRKLLQRVSAHDGVTQQIVDWTVLIAGCYLEGKKGRGGIILHPQCSLVPPLPEMSDRSQTRYTIQ